MEKLLYFVGGIIVGSISTLAALGFTEEELDEVGECGGNFGDVDSRLIWQVLFYCQINLKK